MIDKYKHMYVVGVDLGGTNIRAGKILNGEIISDARADVPAHTINPRDIIDTIVKTVNKVFSKDVEGIGIGIPSLVNRVDGIVYSVQNIPSWENIPLKEILEDIFKVPVFLDNDANCFALGEKIYGKGQNADDFVGLTLGTGLGAGIIKNGTLMQDANCGSGEFGSIPYQDSIYEDYCSGKFFKKEFNQNGEDIFNKALLGEVASQNAFKVFGMHVGNVIKTIMFAIDPKMIILGGSIARARSLYLDSMVDTVRSFPYINSVENLRIVFSDMHYPAVLGASALVFNGIDERVKNLAV